MFEKINLMGGIIFDPGEDHHLQQKDIYIEKGKIKAFEKNTKAQSYDMTGHYISMGWVDSHVHCFPGAAKISLMPDTIGVEQGVTTLIDAGTSGSHTVDTFQKEVIGPSITQVKILLNVASEGLLTLTELSRPEAIEPSSVKAALQRNQNIVGLKVRMSGSVLGDQGLVPLIKAKALALEYDLPLMVHVGNAPPKIEEVLQYLGQGDIVTHAFNGKANGLFLEEGVPKASLQAALERGLKLDVGHGSASFSFLVAKKALAKGIYPQTISTDIYEKNIDGVVGSLAMTMSKMMCAGMSLEQVILGVTKNPSALFGIKEHQRIRLGDVADFTIFKLGEVNITRLDSEGYEIGLRRVLSPEYVFTRGELLAVKKRRENTCKS